MASRTGAPRSTAPARTRTVDVRGALVSAAAVVLEREGEAGLTVRAVAGEAGVAPMGVYNHFAGKDGLLVAVLTQAFDDLRDAMTWDATVGPTTALLAAGHAYRALARSRPTTYRLMFGQKRGDDLDATIEVHAGPAFEGLVDIVRAAQQAGLVRTDDPHALALIIWSAVHGAVSLELADHLGDVDADAAYERVLDLLLVGLRPPSPTPA